MATMTPSSPDPADDAETVWISDDTWSVVLTSDNQTYFNGTITCVQTADVLTIASGVNGTHTLTFAAANIPLAELTTHQIWVNVSDGTGDWDEWVNTSYNFTTGTARARDNPAITEDSGNLALVVMLGVVTVLVVAVAAMRMIDGKADIKELLGMVVIVIILVAVMGFI